MELFAKHQNTTEYFDYDENSGLAIIRTVEDVQPILDRNKNIANDGATDIGIKKGMWCYASIPPSVQLELLQKGCDIFNKNHEKLMFQLLNRDYPYLKTTHKVHHGKS